MMLQFKKNKNYLARYHATQAILLTVTNAILFFMVQPDLTILGFALPGLLLLGSTKIQWVLSGATYLLVAGLLQDSFSPIYFLGLPLAFAMGLTFSGLIHCASHGSLRPRKMNRLIGELMGFLQLSGFADWKIIHVMHHAHTDDPQLDPHPPQEKTYWDYTKGMRQSIAEAYVRAYFKIFGQTPETVQSLKNFARFSRLAHLNKVLFWYLVLKLPLFAFLFAPSIVFKMFQFSLLNWAAHRPSEKGFEIRNLTHGFYKVANFFSFGLYVHGNHHLVPTLFNPKNMTSRTAKESFPNNLSKSA